jgi:cobalt/nickel transport system permease protein
MPGPELLPLWGVHLSDSMLTPEWEWSGLAAAGVLALVGAWRIRDEEIPRVALLTAAFFVAAQIHIRVPGAPTTTHLLLNGLLGVVLGRRALVGIPVGLFLQKVFFEHGGYYALGVNACVMGVPALMAAWLFAGLRRLPWVLHPWFRAGLVGASMLVFVLTLVYAVTLLVTNRARPLADTDLTWANRVTFHPALVAGAVALAAAAAWVERGLGHALEFPIGLVIGEVTVLATVLLNSLVLIVGGQADWHSLALLNFIIHLPLAALEGIILGFTVGFLVRVKPEMLGWTELENKECASDTLS